MTRVHVFCEGQTEAAFVRGTLLPHFQPLGIFLNPILVRTSSGGKGGVSTYGKLKKQFLQKCREDTSSLVTTVLDYYGLPADFPVFPPARDSFARAVLAEQALQADIAMPNFLAHLSIHEFEGLLFSKVEAIAERFPGAADELARIRRQYPSPEHIDSGPDKAPSKRLLALCRGYDKVRHGPLISSAIGLDIIRGECRHFDAWIAKLEQLTYASSGPGPL